MAFKIDLKVRPWKTLFDGQIEGISRMNHQSGETYFDNGEEDESTQQHLMEEAFDKLTSTEHVGKRVRLTIKIEVEE